VKSLESWGVIIYRREISRRGERLARWFACGYALIRCIAGRSVAGLHIRLEVVICGSDALRSAVHAWLGLVRINERTYTLSIRRPLLWHTCPSVVSSRVPDRSEST